jgi:capsule polysaccharide export protein KpsC/LpsZ
VGKSPSALAGLLSLAALGWAQKPSDADAAALIEKSRQDDFTLLDDGKPRAIRLRVKISAHYFMTKRALYIITMNAYRVS